MLKAVWFMAVTGLLSIANGATAITATTDNSACKACYVSTTSRPCLNSAKDASYCCGASEGSTDCTYCGDTTDMTPLNWIYCPVTDAVCSTAPLENSASGSYGFGISIPTGDICVYTMPRVTGSSYDIIRVEGTGMNAYLAYATDKASTNNIYYVLSNNIAWEASQSESANFNYYILIEATSSTQQFTIHYTQRSSSSDSSTIDSGAIAGIVVGLVVFIVIIVVIVWCVKYRAQNIKKAKEKQAIKFKEEEQRRRIQEEETQLKLQDVKKEELHTPIP